MSILAPGVPAVVAALFESGEVEWSRGWGDYRTHTCLHGALLRPCSIPGDEIMWAILLNHRGLTIAWNDEQDSKLPVIEALRGQEDPTETEMVEVFGPDWRLARNVCRLSAVATDEQKRAARAAWAAWAAWAARAARDAWAAWAAWAAWDARDARDTWDARAARAAFFAVCARRYIDESTNWTQAKYDAAVGPFVSVFGELTEGE